MEKSESSILTGPTSSNEYKLIVSTVTTEHLSLVTGRKGETREEESDSWEVNKSVYRPLHWLSKTALLYNVIGFSFVYITEIH